MFAGKKIEKYLARPMHMVKCLISADARTDRKTIISVKQGQLKGRNLVLLDGSQFYSFKGIPYAEPPIGKLRFKAPLPAKAWEGIYDASDHGAPCPQVYRYRTAQLLEGDEDCLFLNVYTKSLTTKSPVMVFIHGGSYAHGSGDSTKYGPEYFLLHDVVLVTLNYRLEVLGFLCLETAEVPGNAGMKDQVLALRWIKDNIASFGGDPGNVTVFGQSVGGSSATLHALSPMSKGLCHKVIAQSGTALNDWAIAYDAKERAFRLGGFLGIETKDPKELLAFLQGLPAATLTGVTHNTMTDHERYRGLPIHFSPVVEKKFDGVDAFITEEPLDLLLKGNTSKLPTITGFNSGEGIVLIVDHLKKKKIFNEITSHLVPKEIADVVTAEKLKQFGDRIKNFYVGTHRFSKRTIPAIVNYNTDVHWAYPAFRFAELYHKFAPVYLYKFDYDCELNLVKYFLDLNKLPGAAHGDELFYLFFNEFNEEIYNEHAEIPKTIFTMTKYWTDFAKTGNPTPSKEGVQWSPYLSSNKNYMQLQKSPLVKTYEERERIIFWDKIYSESGLPSITK